MRQRVRDLIEEGDRLFSQRSQLMTLWQSLAENVHPLRADFTRQRSLGEEFASFMMTGRPAIAHRDLTNSIGAMLRPRDKVWARVRTGNTKVNQKPGPRQWLDWASEVQHRGMYDRRAQYLSVSKAIDGDFVAFGQGVVTIDPNRWMDGILYRDWHVKDVAWAEGPDRIINQVHFNWNPEVHQLCAMPSFKDKLSPKVIERNKDKDKFGKVRCRRIVIPVDNYDMDPKLTRGMGFVSIYVDCENLTILEEIPTRTGRFVIPRWERLSGSQYAFSMAAMYALPDARMMQVIAMTIMEAGQKAVDPPTISVGEAINGGVNLYAGGNTNVDADYDERLGEVLRPITQKTDGLGFAASREERLEKIIQDTFFLSKINMPTVTKEMTATETQRIYEEFIRGALPLLEPIEVEMNGQICSESFDVMRDMGTFGSPLDMPQELRGEEIRYEFDSPLQEAADRAKVGYFQQSIQITAEAMQIDPNAKVNFDVNKGHRDALGSTGAPADWVRSEDDAKAMLDQKQQQDQAAEAAAAMATGADTATRLATAGSSAAEAAQRLQQSGMI
ncbi:MAG: portal protein [Pseudomonadota bacterium]